MNEEALALWDRAVHSLHAAELLTTEEPDSAVSRAYYAAFHAVSALFALRGQTFTRHTAVEAAVHRDLVKAAAWEGSLGEDYSFLAQLRHTGDYGGRQRVGVSEAQDAVVRAQRILTAVGRDAQGAFPERNAAVQ